MKNPEDMDGAHIASNTVQLPPGGGEEMLIFIKFKLPPSELDYNQIKGFVIALRTFSIRTNEGWLWTSAPISFKDQTHFGEPIEFKGQKTDKRPSILIE